MKKYLIKISLLLFVFSKTMFAQTDAGGWGFDLFYSFDNSLNMSAEKFCVDNGINNCSFDDSNSWGFLGIYYPSSFESITIKEKIRSRYSGVGFGTGLNYRNSPTPFLDGKAEFHALNLDLHLIYGASTPTQDFYKKFNQKDVSGWRLRYSLYIGISLPYSTEITYDGDAFSEEAINEIGNPYLNEKLLILGGSLEFGFLRLTLEKKGSQIATKVGYGVFMINPKIKKVDNGNLPQTIKVPASHVRNVKIVAAIIGGISTYGMYLAIDIYNSSKDLEGGIANEASKMGKQGAIVIGAGSVLGLYGAWMAWNWYDEDQIALVHFKNGKPKFSLNSINTDFYSVSANLLGVNF